MGGFSLLADALLRDSSRTWLTLIRTASSNRLELEIHIYKGRSRSIYIEHFHE